MGIFPIFLSERHSVEYMSEPSIISSQYKFYAFIFIFDIGKTLVERLDTFYSRTDIFFGIGYFVHGNTECLSRTRHQLHKPSRSGPRYRQSIEMGFVIGLGGKYAPVPIYLLGIFFKKRVVDRYLSFGYG